MATAPKKLATAVTATITDTGALSVVFSNGKSMLVHPNMLLPEITAHAVLHGLKQKLVDAAAIGRDPDTGRTATIDDKYNAVKEVFDRITGANGATPTWNKVRTDGNGSKPGTGGLLVRAMMMITNKPRDFILATLEAKTKEEIAALRKNPRIVEAIAKLQIEQANTSGIDSDALLDSLLDGSTEMDTAMDADAEMEMDEVEGVEALDEVEEMEPPSRTVAIAPVAIAPVAKAKPAKAPVAKAKRA